MSHPRSRDISPQPFSESHPRPRRQANFDQDPSKPLLDTEMVNTSGPPLAGPETDDSDDRETVGPQPGVDDGFFVTTRNGGAPNGNPNGNPDAENVPKRPVNPVSPSVPEVGDIPDLGRFPANHPNPRRGSGFPYAPGFGPEVVNMPDFAPTEFGESIPDINVYQHKKTLAQGMMDLALFSANANQLRYVLESYDRHPYYYPSVVLISLSLIIQVAVGIGLIWNAHYNVKDRKEICIANKISNMTIIGIFVVTVVNVFISAFGVANAPVVVGGRAGTD